MLQIDFEKIEPLENSYLLTPKINNDQRGSLIEIFKVSWFSGLPGWSDFSIKQQNFVLSAENSIRGIHLTKSAFPQRKIIFVTEGRICEFLVNLNPESNNFQRTFSFELDYKQPRILLLGSRNGHSFQTMTENSKVVYCFDREYEPDHELGLNPIKNNFVLPWNFPAILSPKDAEAISFQDALDSEYFS